MANCNKLFQDFNSLISLTQSRKTKLRKSRTALESIIREALNKKENIKFKGFYIQGSTAKVFQTAVLKTDGTYDVDLGVYLNEKPTDISCTTVQKYVFDAVKDHTDAGAKHLKKCVRVFYAGDFDIDLPVYYINDDEDIPYLAVKSSDWRKDDPKGTSKWFNEKKDDDGQLVRIIKYLKIWSDKELRGFKMPSGFALTVWVANHFEACENRDDKALLQTMKNIKDSFGWIFIDIQCYSPCAPKDDLVSNLDDTQKDKFLVALKEFIKDAEKAIDSKNQLKASEFWQTHLGNRFPSGADEDVDAKEAKLRNIANDIKAGAKLSASGIIQTDSGISHAYHRNFGGNGKK